jgi:DNA-directed RNA polymerase specialized sigma24 family protein
MGSPQERWILTREAFEKFLAVLDPDLDRAGKVYEEIRSKLLTFFRCNGCREGESLADETLDRTVRRMSEIEVRDIMPFIRGIARNVASESHKRSTKTPALEDVPAPVWDRARIEESIAADPVRLGCLENCLKKLPSEEEKLIREYYQDEKRQKIDRKRRLAET